MQPDLQNGEENPYGFIFDQNSQTTPGTNTAAVGADKTKQYLLFGVFALAILAIAGIAATIFLKPTPPSAPELVRVRAIQNELIRVREIGNKNLGQYDLRKDVDTINLVLQTDTATISGLIRTRGVVTLPGELSQFKNSTYDTSLQNALSNDTHDTVYRDIVDQLAGQYYESVKAAENRAVSRTEQAQLAAVRSNIEITFDFEDPSESTESTERQDTATEPSEPDADTADEPIPSLFN